ncbi:F-box protein CPR30-like [Chenopodium quinoa]|uniref:F-box protein CPR30-like n=1 Tax=Chenopodium quinoa TaxID=63459 RepID=UPI000B777B79|nr:F-box protein CPR30-like [Chenopodium quinoa]XP_021723787.1 F-box protein CPR30-like [Chenopodium quinoa]
MATLHLPWEIISREILPKLPAKSLLRFKCVSKSFKTLISTPEFINSHLSSNTNRHLLLINKTDQQLYSLDLDTPNSAVTRLPLRHRFNDYDCFVLSSCNGLICFVQINTESCCYYQLFNLSTGVYKNVDFDISDLLSFGNYLNFGFGFDCENDDYKLVIIVDYFDAMVYDVGDEANRRQVIVCSSNTSCKRLVVDKLSPRDTVILQHMAVTENSSKLNCMFWTSSMNKHRCGCFDVCGERWVEDVPLPDYNGGEIEKLHDFVDIGAIDGCLCLLTVNHRHSSVDVWIMKEYRVKESWVKLLDVSDSVVTRSLKVVPFAYGKNSEDDVLFLKDDTSELVWYNRLCKTTVKAEICGVPEINKAFMCKDSLVTISGGKQMKWN